MACQVAPARWPQGRPACLPAGGSRHACCMRGWAAACMHAGGPTAGLPACLWAAACVRVHARGPDGSMHAGRRPRGGHACLPACSSHWHACARRGASSSMACMHAGGPKEGLPARRWAAACMHACRGVAPACVHARGPEAGPPACPRAAAYMHMHAGGGGTSTHARMWPRGRHACLRARPPVGSSVRACMQVAGGSMHAGRWPQGRHKAGLPACLRAAACMHAGAPRRASLPAPVACVHACRGAGSSMHACRWP